MCVLSPVLTRPRCYGKTHWSDQPAGHWSRTGSRRYKPRLQSTPNHRSSGLAWHTAQRLFELASKQRTQQGMDGCDR